MPTVAVEVEKGAEALNMLQTTPMEWFGGRTRRKPWAHPLQTSFWQSAQHAESKCLLLQSRSKRVQRR